jgi:hypothetical protein
MHTSALITRRLAALGVAKPTPQLVAAIELRLAPRVAALIERTVTKPLVARAFASTLVEVKGSEEGSAAPALPSSDWVGLEQDSPINVAGTTAAAAANTEAR